MKPPAFAYQPVSSAAEAAGVLAQAGDQAAVLAGGQSLMIELRYRRVRPGLLVDINPARELQGIETAGDWARIGALARHHDLESPALADPLGTLLARAARYVAHPPIRARGTLAGSVAWAHPAAEWCAVTAGLAGEIELASQPGRRTVPAAQWFTGRHQTARRPDELVTAVRLPLLGAGTGVGFAEHRRTHGSFAMAAAMAAVRVENGRARWVRIGLANAADVPVRALAAEQLMTGAEITRELLAAAAGAAADAADPVPEPYCSPAYRRQVLRVLVRRSLAQATGGDQPEGERR